MLTLFEIKWLSFSMLRFAIGALHPFDHAKIVN